ncbi:response regulator [Desulfosporosinus sp. PR]|uniref:response regulator n=1 Tax=Candidatus Desulfosporosinus nitrosoreducens TaxID=3401928 RepID=UPI0027F3F9DE|nr:response regulator [Desulfosporosinus sp. PR]MDQ7092854.1 response regulator [Desulfosporosinus sp. PR]
MKNNDTSILVVEDDPNSSKLLFDLLTAHGYTVICEITGLAAEQRINQEKADIVLLDLRLPEQNGFMVAQYIRQNPDTKHIPIIVLSAFYDRQNKLRAYQSGVNFMLSKPFDSSELLMIINNLFLIQENK